MNISRTEACLLLSPCFAVLSTIVLWLGDVWATGLFGGIGTAFLTPFIALGLGIIAIRRPDTIVVSENKKWVVAVYLGASLLAVALLIDAGESSIWIGVLAIVWPIWLLSWIGYTFGNAMARRLVFPVLFLWFCLPFEPYFYETLDTPLQEMTTDVAVVMLRTFGHPVQYWNAHTFYTADFWIIVDETCSGMNMIVTLTMYALIFGWVTRHRLSSRLILVLSVLPFALLSNGLRVAAIYLLGLHGGEELAKGFWHDGSGVVAFLPTLLGIYAIGEGLRWVHRRRAKSGKTSNSTTLPTG